MFRTRSQASENAEERPSPPVLESGLLATVVVITTLAAYLVRQQSVLGAGWSSFVFAGALISDPERVPDELVVTQPGAGYDGQYVYRLSLDPFTSTPTDFGVTLDNPAYRQQRILLPLVAWALHRATGVSTLVWLPVLNVVAAVGLTLVARVLLRRAGAPGIFSACIGLAAPVLIGVSRDLNEPVSLALMLGSVLLVTSGRPWSAGALAALAVLAKETTLVVPLAVGIVALFRLAADGRSSRYWQQAGAALLPGATYVLWHLWLAARWSQGDPQGTSEHLAVPGRGAIRSLFIVNLGPDTVTSAQEVLWLVGRWALILSLVMTAVALARSRAALEVKVAWVLASLVALSVPGWLWGAQFTRAAAEAIILGSMVLAMHDRGRAPLVLSILLTVTTMLAG